MGIWAWVILLAWSALLATAAQYVLFREDRKPNDYHWGVHRGRRPSRRFQGSRVVSRLWTGR